MIDQGHERASSRRTCFQSPEQVGEVVVAAGLQACGEQNACCGEEVDANPCHDHHVQGSCAAKDPAVENQHGEVSQNDEIKNDLNSAAVNYAEEEGSGEARNCSRPPSLNIRIAPG